MKNFMILGDSYSTYAGCIPEGYAVYYCKEGREGLGGGFPCRGLSSSCW